MDIVLASGLKQTINADIGGVGMLFSRHALKSLNSREKIQTRMMCATFNRNSCPTSVSCYTVPQISVMKQTSPPSIMSYLLLSDTFPNNILIIRRDMMVNI